MWVWKSMDSCILVKLPAGSLTYLMQSLLLSWLVVPSLGQFCQLAEMETGFWWKSSSDNNIVFKKDRHHKSGVRGIHTLTSLYSVSTCLTVFPMFHLFPGAAKEARQGLALKQSCEKSCPCSCTVQWVLVNCVIHRVYCIYIYIIIYIYMYNTRNSVCKYIIIYMSIYTW